MLYLNHLGGGAGISTQAFSLSGKINKKAAAKTFKKSQRVLIPDILDKNCANELVQHLAAMAEWNLVFRNRQKHYDLSASGFEKLEANEKTEIKNSVYSSAQQDFGYMYKNYPIYDLVQTGSCSRFLQGFYEFLNSQPLLNTIRQISGLQDIEYADAQATRYDPGHFLTSHDDTMEGKQRLAAYVFNLTPDWHPDWGGNLMFYGGNRQVMDVFVPSMNSLSLFAVGEQHAVSVISPIARQPRLAITGWFRRH